LEFKVNQKVLIPRPETEILVENILNLVDKKNEILILDIACGSGNIGIALAVNLPSAKLICTDKSQEALEVAKENAERNSVLDRIQFVKHDILKEGLDDFSEFDVIVSNPPYVSKVDYLTLQREIRDYEPKSAVTDDGDGYTFYRAIAVKSSRKIRIGGHLFFEIAQGQSERVIQIMEKNNFKEISVTNDYQKIDRIVFGVRK
jgi:release factor glutamine methyltransferase